MTKIELVEFVAEFTELSKKDAAKAVDGVFKGIEKGMVEDGDVTIVGFGKFAVKERAAREGINPATKEAIKIPAKKVPSFKAGSKLKEAVK